MRLPNPVRSNALLVGTSQYTTPELPSIPAVPAGLNDLRSVLTDPQGGGFQQQSCTVLVDPAGGQQIMEAISEASAGATDVFLLYYVGHGLIGANGELYLGTTGTDQNYLDTSALRWSTVADALRQSRASTRVVILDCCFSGRAIDGTLSDGSNVLAAMTDVSGSYVLTSAARHALSIAREGDPYTAFTGELIRILSEGIPGGPNLLPFSAIYAELHRTMTALGYPAPNQRGTNRSDQLCLVRNAAFAALEIATEPGAEQTEPSFAPTPEPEEEVEVDVRWASDSPATRDNLRRGYLADVITQRLLETHGSDPHTSFLVHVDGPWGSGKSTLLNLLTERIEEDFRVVRFDAWQQLRLAPSWWSLLIATRHAITQGRSWWQRPVLRLAEASSRIRRTGATYLLALALFLVGSSALAAIIAGLGTLGTGTLVASRFLLWDSARGARIFEQSQTNPLGEVANHFRWLLTHSDRPVAFFIDDLDRCEQSKVVDLLDTIQTLVRSTPNAGVARRATAAHFVVAADGSWLRNSYETAYAGFADSIAEPGRPLGYLFLDKLFQLTVPVPKLVGETQAAFLDTILGVADIGEPTAEAALPAGPGRNGSATTRDDGHRVIRRRLREFADGRDRQAVQVLINPASHQGAQHALRQFSPLLGDNPRAIKKFVNTFSILRSMRTLEGNYVGTDSLALWAVVSVRWPSLAQRLESCPDAVIGIINPLWCSEHFSSSLRDLAASAEIRDIITSALGGPLTPDLIRHCCGTPIAPDRMRH